MNATYGFHIRFVGESGEGKMTKPAPPGGRDARKPYISPPPSKEDVDQVSRDQALIADEWAPAPAPPSKPEDT